MSRKKSSEEIHASETKFVAICDLLKTAMVISVVGFLGYRVIEMMTVALSAKPETLDSFAKCLSEWKVANIIFAIVSIITGGGWYIEHQRNNNLVQSNGDLRHEKESRDVVSTRSGLDKVGRTPKE